MLVPGLGRTWAFLPSPAKTQWVGSQRCRLAVLGESPTHLDQGGRPPSSPDRAGLLECAQGSEAFPQITKDQTGNSLHSGQAGG